jgi:hypothetical protein
MGWLEFAVIVGCCLVGFIIMNAVIDARRTKAEGQQKDGDAKKQDSGSKDEDPTKKTDDRQRRTSPPRSWWETLNVDQNASTEQIKARSEKRFPNITLTELKGWEWNCENLPTGWQKRSTTPTPSLSNNAVLNSGHLPAPPAGSSEFGLLGHHPEQPTPAPSANGWLTLSSPDAATLAHGLRITPAFLESRRRSQTRRRPFCQQLHLKYSGR